MSQSESIWPTILATVVKAVRRRPWLVPLTAIVAGVLAYAISSVQPQRFDATSTLLFQQVDPAPRVDPNATIPESTSTPERTAATNLALASAAADAVTLRVKQRLRSPLAPGDLRRRVALAPEGQSDTVTIKATGDSAAGAARIANVYAQEIVQLRRQRAQQTVQRVVDALDARIAALDPADANAATLQTRRQQLEVEKTIQTGDVEWVGQAVPPLTASSPRPLFNSIVGALLGALLGLGLAVALHRRDRAVEDEEQLESIVGAEVLARVPYRTDSLRDRELFREALHFLRTNLQLRETAQAARVIGFVSPTPGNGKSVVAVGLADALATSGSDVVVIDCDLRRPALHRYLHGELSPGIVNVIDGSDETSALLQETSHSGVRLVAAGAALSESTSSTVSLGRITRLLRQMRQAADYVIVDTSALTIGADSIVVAKALDGVILVVDLRVIDRDALAEATDQLHGAGVRIFGIVLNRSDPVRPRWRTGPQDGIGDLLSPLRRGHEEPAEREGARRKTSSASAANREQSEGRTAGGVAELRPAKGATRSSAPGSGQAGKPGSGSGSGASAARSGRSQRRTQRRAK